MPRHPSFRFALPVLLPFMLLSAGATGAASASLPIQIDGVFSDWNAAVAGDPFGDAGSSGIDFTQLWTANDENWLFVRFDTGIEVEPDEGHDIRLILDTDDNAGTGLAIAGVGAELVWSLGQRSGTLHLTGGSQATSHSQIGLVIAPTVTFFRRV